MRTRRRSPAGPSAGEPAFLAASGAASLAIRAAPGKPAAGVEEGKPPPPAARALDSMPPAGTLARGRGRLFAEEEGRAFVFEFGDLRYRLGIGSPNAPTPLLRIEAGARGGEWRPICDGAGMLLRDESGTVFSPLRAAERLEVVDLRAVARGKTLALRYSERFGEALLHRTLQVRLVGRSLVLQLAAEGRSEGAAGRRGDGSRSPRRPVAPAPPPPAVGYCGFSFGTLGGSSARETLVPYTIDPVYLLENGWFAAAYVDRLTSGANACPRGTAFYRADSLGALDPISETLYVTAAADPLETLPLLATSPSSDREELARRVVLDVWSEAPFGTDRETFARLRRYGLADILVHYQTWQHYGFGQRLPAQYPANPERGTNEEFRQLVQCARAQGWLVALREDYSALSPDTSFWDESAVARTADGAPRPARLGGFAIAADRMLSFARLESTKIERNYAPGAASIGSGAAYNPEDQLHQIDLDARHPASRTMAAALRHCQALFQYLKALHGGPLIGEGGEGPGRFDTYYAGVVDGFERPLDGRASGPVIVDYELTRVQPVMANHGVGYYGRFFNEIHGEQPIDPERVSWDLYRATEIAFAHAGFLSTAQVPAPPLGPWVPLGSMREAFTEYFLMRAVQERLMLTPVQRIEYHHADERLDLAGALRAGIDLAQPQLRIEYERGLTVFVNRHARLEWPIRWEGQSYVLPPSGWLVGDGRELLAYSALIAGNRADLVRSPAYTFLSVRSDVARRIEGITTDGAVALVRGAVDGQRDIFACDCKSVAESEELLKLSDRADFSLIHRSTRAVELCVLDSESGRSVNVTLPALGPEWEPGRLLLDEREGGEWRRAPNQIQPTRRGLQLARLRPDVVYRLTRPDGRD